MLFEEHVPESIKSMRTWHCPMLRALCVQHSVVSEVEAVF